jgi:hypothetical protein
VTNIHNDRPPFNLSKDHVRFTIVSGRPVEQNRQFIPDYYELMMSILASALKRVNEFEKSHFDKMLP